MFSTVLALGEFFKNQFEIFNCVGKPCDDVIIVTADNSGQTLWTFSASVAAIPAGGTGATSILSDLLGVLGRALGVVVSALSLSSDTRQDQFLYRVHGGASPKDGQFWTNVDPRAISNYRDAAGLPNSNTGEFLTGGYLIDRAGVVIQPAASLDGNSGGGVMEYIVPNPNEQIQYYWTEELDPSL